MAWTFFTVLKSNHIIHQVLTESAPQRLFLRMSNRSGFFRLPCSFLGNMRENPTLPREVTMHEIPSIECMQCNAVGPIRSNFAARLPSRRPIEIPLNFILLLWRISSPPSPSSPPLRPSFVSSRAELSFHTWPRPDADAVTFFLSLPYLRI